MSYRGQYDPSISSSSLGGVLGPDGKLSSAGAAASLKYAKPHELPSHPSVGVDTSMSANKAAHIAANGGSPDPFRHSGNRQPSYQPSFVSEEGRQKALLAATTSVNRRGPKHAPTPPLTTRQAQATRVRRFEGMGPEMFTEHPPVEVELEAQRYQAALRASALSMAKQLYKLEQNKQGESPTTGKPAYPGLNEAAQQAAAKRLAKLDPDGIQAYREHYGYGISLGRSGVVSDAAQASKIRGQMSQFNALLTNVDEEKRQKDRDALMALAEKRVQERLKALDEKVFNETGQMLPSISAEWEAEARAKAEENASTRQLTTTKVHIGGGKYIDMSEVEAIAEARMKPTLDEITETAQKRRERDEEIRLAEEERRKQLAEERAEQQRDKDERRMKEYQQKNELRAQMAVEKAERDKIRNEENAERRRIKDEERMKKFREKNERKAQEAEERVQRKQYEDQDKAERKKYEDEQKAERRRVEGEQKVERDRVAAERKAAQAEEKAQRDQRRAEEKQRLDRIKAEERADKQRLRAEQKADREAKRTKDREERLARIADEQEKAKEKARLIEEGEEEEGRISTAIAREDEEEAAKDAKDEADAAKAAEAEDAYDDEDLGPTDLPGSKRIAEEAEEDDAATQVKIDATETKEADFEATENIVKEEMTEDGLTREDTAHNIAERVLSSPVEAVAEAEPSTVTRTLETEDGGVKTLEEDAPVKNDTASPAESSSKLFVPADTPMPRRESRRASFFNKLKSSIKGSNSRPSTWAQYKSAPSGAEPAAAEEKAASETASKEVAESEEVKASTDGTEEAGKSTDRAESEGGLYSEPSDTTERPNEERAAEHGDNVSSMYATDDADYDEARARTSESSAERFTDANTELEPPTPAEETPHSKFQEAL